VRAAVFAARTAPTHTQFARRTVLAAEFAVRSMLVAVLFAVRAMSSARFAARAMPALALAACTTRSASVFGADAMLATAEFVRRVMPVVRFAARAMLAVVLCACAVVGASICSGVCAWGQANEAAVEGKRVAEIRIVDESGAVLPDPLPEIPMEVGKPLEMEAERTSLKILYATGRYAEIRTDATPVPDGLRIDFVVEKNMFNNVLRIEGLKEPPTEASALAALRMPLGQPFRQSALDEGMQRLRDSLHDEGLYQSHVGYSLERHTETQQMDVHVSISPGPRARIGAITVVNHGPFSDKELLSRSRLKTKQDVTSSRISKATDRLRKKLVADGYLGATATVKRGDYDAKSNQVPLTLEVTGGPRVRVEIVGAHFSKGKLRKLLPIYAEGAVDEDLLQEGLRNIRDELQRESYFDSQADYSSAEDTARNERVITYTVIRGEKHRLLAVTFSGNKYFSTKLLASRLQLQTQSFQVRGKFSQRMVKDDSDSILGVYQANGFLQASVKSQVVDDVKGKTGDISVHYDIAEGPQTKVADLKIEGNKTIATKDLINVIESSPGEPYSDSNVAGDRNNMLALYYNDGFPDVQVEGQATPAGEPDKVNVVFKITEGRRVDVLRVLLTGYEHTRYGVIAREVQVKPGGPLREGDVIESQRNLYNLAIFNRVQIAPQNPDGTDTDKTVVVAVEEGRRYTIGYGGGIEVQELPGSGTNPTGTTLNASPRVIFEFGRNNLEGRGQSISFKVRASTLQYRGVLTYTAPHFLNDKRFSLQLTAYADKTQDVNTFTSERYEGAVQFVDAVSRQSSVLFRYFFRHVIVLASTLKITPDEIPLFSQPTLISGFGVSWAQDKRNNATDATKGMYNSIDFSVAGKPIGSSASFLRFFEQNSTFTPFWRSFVFARAIRFGVEHPFPDTTADEIPLPERFFAGGGQSLRGFGLNQAGPRDPVTGFPVGGLALLEFNQELRFPLKLPYAGNKIGGTIFYDAGNVYTDVSHITWRYTPSSETDLNYLSHTVGGGLRYATPIGPVRIDFGYQINPAKFSFVNSTTMQPETQRLPHFQFFFNIGPVF
jgi:outer membrane protein insertion porin family